MAKFLYYLAGIMTFILAMYGFSYGGFLAMLLVIVGCVPQVAILVALGLILENQENIYYELKSLKGATTSVIEDSKKNTKTCEKCGEIRDIGGNNCPFCGHS